MFIKNKKNNKKQYHISYSEFFISKWSAKKYVRLNYFIRVFLWKHEDTLRLRNKLISISYQKNHQNLFTNFILGGVQQFESYVPFRIHLIDCVQFLILFSRSSHHTRKADAMLKMADIFFQMMIFLINNFSKFSYLDFVPCCYIPHKTHLHRNRRKMYFFFYKKSFVPSEQNSSISRNHLIWLINKPWSVQSLKSLQNLTTGKHLLWNHYISWWLNTLNSWVHLIHEFTSSVN